MRKLNDAYYTSESLAFAIVSRLWEILPLYTDTPAACKAGQLPRILEPSAGGGAFVKAARQWWPSTHITAIEPNAAAGLSVADAIRTGTLEAECAGVKDLRYALALGNPPYSAAETHVQLLRPICHYVAFLLRLSFLGSQRRAQTIHNKPGLRYLIPLAQRPSFTGGGTDNSEYAVFVWQRDWVQPATVLSHVWVQP